MFSSEHSGNGSAGITIAGCDPIHVVKHKGGHGVFLSVGRVAVQTMSAVSPSLLFVILFELLDDVSETLGGF